MAFSLKLPKLSSGPAETPKIIPKSSEGFGDSRDLCRDSRDF